MVATSLAVVKCAGPAIGKGILAMSRKPSLSSSSKIRFEVPKTNSDNKIFVGGLSTFG
jgi:hypothetical protein